MLRSSRPIKMKSSDWWAHRPWQPGSGHGKGQENGLNHLSFRLNLKKSYLSYLTFDVRVLIYIYTHYIYIKIKWKRMKKVSHFNSPWTCWVTHHDGLTGLGWECLVTCDLFQYDITGVESYFSYRHIFHGDPHTAIVGSKVWRPLWRQIQGAGFGFWVERRFFKGLGHIFWVQPSNHWFPWCD